MSVVDLHPEELLDKDARGELSTEERARLETHLARCSACRAERVLRMDFADELGEGGESGEGAWSPREERPSALLDLVQGALAAPRAITTTPDTTNDAPAPAPVPAPEPKVLPELEAIPGLRRRPRRTAVVLLVAAAVLAASAAGATGMTTRVWSRLRGGSLETTHASATSMPTSAPVASPVAPRKAAPTLAAPSAELEPPAPEAIVAPSPEPVALPVQRVSFDPVAQPAPIARALPVQTSVSERVAAPSIPERPERVAAVAPPVRPTDNTASGLFESANAARRAGDTATALARYDALEAQFPGTREARVAKATTGRLLLDRGDPAGALARFDAYLASGSSELREEAMAGRATALERLGRGDEESRAWAALLATYPGTPYGAHARARVAASPVRSLAQ